MISLLLATSLILASNDHWKGDEYAKNSESQKESALSFMQKVHLLDGQSILDIGCGDGKVTAGIAKDLPHSQVLGVDISSSMIQFAQAAFSNVDNLKFETGDATHLDYEEKFDLVISFSVMQWVVEQKEALKCFKKALKPNGKLWIQMPMGLPIPMQHALERTMSSEKWESYFVNFSVPWKFYTAEEYKTLLSSTNFTPSRVEVITTHERFPSRAIFKGFIKQWFPYLRALPEDQKDAFLSDFLDHYLNIEPVDEQGRVSFVVNRLEIEAF